MKHNEKERKTSKKKNEASAEEKREKRIDRILSRSKEFECCFTEPREIITLFPSVEKEKQTKRSKKRKEGGQ